MSVNDKCIENLVMTYQFHSIDAYENDQYFFKPSNKTSYDRLCSFFKDHSDFDLKFVYRKKDDLSVKIKHKHIKDFFEIDFQKGKEYMANLHLVYYENKETKGYYPKIELMEQDVSDEE